MRWFMQTNNLLGCAALVLGLIVEPDTEQWLSGEGIVKQAEARVGRPGTPRSYAGVARRTTRRVVRRTTIYVASLPPNCSQISVNGDALYLCGGTYYQSVGAQYVVVTVE